MRQDADAWLCSACLRLVNGVPGPALTARLGWARPLPATTLAAQLLELGKLHGEVRARCAMSCQGPNPCAPLSARFSHSVGVRPVHGESSHHHCGCVARA